MNARPLMPVGSVEVTWRQREDRTGQKDLLGRQIYEQWPRPSPACHFHPEQLAGHHYGGFRWQLFINGVAQCELCLVDRFLDGEAVLVDLEGFETMVKTFEDKGIRDAARAGNNPPLARRVADAGGVNWGTRAMAPLVRAYQVAERHPLRAAELRAAITEKPKARNARRSDEGDTHDED